jgi:hypothetical protein
MAAVLFFWGKFSPLHNAKNPLRLIQRISHEKKSAKVAPFSRNCFSEITIFQQQVPTCCKNILGFLKKFLLTL